MVRWAATPPPLLPALAAVLVVSGDSKYVTIANSANITRCLGVQDLHLTLTDCITHIGAEWQWNVESASQGGRMRLAGYTAQLLAGNECLDEDLKFRRCTETPTWLWNNATLQLQLRTKGKTWCLGLIGHELLMDHCHVLNGTTSDDQNGYGAPAEQSWVLLPTIRPQITILDRLAFPLRASGSNILDSEGRRVKLAGVNWLGAHMEQLVNNGLNVAPIKRIVKTIKYMGFNSVRLSYASAMVAVGVSGRRRQVPDENLLKANPQLKGLSALEVFDKTVKAITEEGLLVVICRNMHEPGWCCHGTDGSELWYGEGHSTEDWLDNLTFMAERYRKNPRVIGVDIFNEPRMREKDGTIPWWGVATGLTQMLRFNFADWRVAAARGAVAVWRGNPDALVIIEGQMYASNLERVMDRPLKFADSCLQSRIVFSSHEFFWHWKIDRFYRHVADTLRPFTFFQYLTSTLREAYMAGDEDEFGSSPSFSDVGRRIHADFSYTYQGGTGLITYEDWADARGRAVFYLARQNQAPVWVSAFGTSRKADNAWWAYILRYFRETDISWCYWPLDAVAIPRNFNGNDNSFKLETYGIFDTSRTDYSAVIGWKLQDLVSIQAPSDDHPSTLPVPPKCSFELEPNLERSAEATGVVEFLTTMAWSPQAVLEAVFLVLLVLLVPCLCCCCLRWTLSALRQQGRERGPKAWPVAPHEQEYLALNGHVASKNGLGSGLGGGMASRTRIRGQGTVIDAQPLAADFETRLGPEERGNGGGGAFFCCSKRRIPKSAWQMPAGGNSARRVR